MGSKNCNRTRDDTAKMTAPSPNNAPTSLSALYERETGAQAADEDIKAVLEGLPKERRQVVSLYLKGYSSRQIGMALGIRGASAQSRLRFCMRRVYRVLTGNPWEVTQRPASKPRIGPLRQERRPIMLDAVKHANRSRTAMKLRSAGYTFREIGAALGVSHEYARRLWMKGRIEGR